MKYEFICERQDYSVSKWAAFLKVSQSGYYEWRKLKKKREEEHMRLRRLVRKIFFDHHGTYGPDRLCGALRRMGEKASYRKIQKIMQEEGLVSIHCRRRNRSLTDSRKSRGEGYDNLTKETVITRPFQVLSSDISYIRTLMGFLYLCIVRDVVSGVILAIALSDRMKAELVETAVKRALQRWEIPKGCIFHSDRGSQYTSRRVRELLLRHGIRQSFSRVGMPGDNAWSESFFANLKKEAVHWRIFRTREEAGKKIFGYVEAFYNTKRIQKRLGYLSPLQWLERWYMEEQQRAA